MSKESSGVKGKRCLFLTNYFYPEVFRGNDIAFEMVKRGYEVTVITVSYTHLDVYKRQINNRIVRAGTLFIIMFFTIYDFFSFFNSEIWRDSFIEYHTIFESFIWR